MRRSIGYDTSDPKTRREFRASLGTRNARRMDTKVKRAKSGKLTDGVRKSYAWLVRVWAAKQEGPI